MPEEEPKRRGRPSKKDLDKQSEEIANTAFIEEDPPVTEYLPTGCTTLDLAIANKFPGGFPIGRVVEVSGPPSASKSVLGMTASGACQRAGGIVFYRDIEGTFDFQWAEMYGLDPKNIDTFRLRTGENAPRTIEEIFDKDLAAIIALDDDRPKLYIIDTLAAVSSNAEIENPMDKASFGASRAKLMSLGFRKYPPAVLAKARISLVCLNQIRDNISGYGAKHTTSGGWAIDFYSSVRIEVKCGKKIENSKKIKTGVWIEFTVTKNKIAPPYREDHFRIMWNYGLDDIFSCISFLYDRAKCGEGNKVSFNNESKAPLHMLAYVEKEGLEKELQKKVVEEWFKLHAVPDRKTRVW